MKRLSILILLLAAPAAAQAFSGEDLYRLCETNQPACGDFIRTALKRAGWAERVPFSYMLDRGKLEWLVCPAGDSRDRFLASAYRNFWRSRRVDLDEMSAHEAAIRCFRERDPNHDCSAGKKT